MTRRLAVAVALLLAGCAAPEHARVASTEPPTVNGEELRRAADELRRRDTELQQFDLQPTAPDCARIAPLSDNICALAARICQIAELQPAGSNAALNASLQCEDGKTRCKRAVERAQARGCPHK